MARSTRRKPRKHNLRDLLDFLERGQPLMPVEKSSAAAEHARAAGLDIERVAENAICFDAGDYDTLSQRRIIPENCRLPYEVCWFRFRITDPTEPFFVYALALDQGDHVLLIELMEVDSHWAFNGACEVVHLGSDACRSIGSPWGNSTARLGAASFLSALNCRNVHQAERPPRAKRQRMRARQGKRPLFSYWTLHLDQADGSRRELGGTHASPRVHLRRGHPRQYAPGQWTWVQPHAVGSPARGMVHKDYDGRELSED